MSHYNTNLSSTGWIRTRFNRIIKHYGKEFFNEKSMLEIGCLCGDLGNLFYNINTNVTCMDGRQENINMVNSRYPHLPTYKFDLNDGLGTTDMYDIILHFGVLYHLVNWKDNLKNSCNQSTHLLLETEVSDSDDSNFELILGEPDTPQQSLNQSGIRPSPAAIESQLTINNMKFIRIFDELNSEGHSYTWSLLNTKTSNGPQMRAMWFCEKIK